MGPIRKATQGTAGGETGERLFKRCQRLFRLEQQEISAIFTFIKAHAGQYPVNWMCQKLQVSRASYYRWLNPCEELSQAQALRRRRTELVHTEFEASNQVAGAGQLVDLLRNNHEEQIPKSTVLSIMKDLGIQAKRMSAFKTTTVRDHQARTAHIKNHMVDKLGRRDFRSCRPGAKLVGDITYLRTGEGWLYLATVIDLYSRQIVGWSMGENMQTQLVIDAMELAASRGFIQPGTVFHSDRGTQYTSGAFQAWCAEQGVRQSMGRTGVCWDNSVAESTFSTIKNEMYHHRAFTSRVAARTAVMEYIEVWYNRKRPHTANGGLSPQAVLDSYQERNSLALAA
ncbi:transposase of ISAar25, IS3 family, IS3 group, orfB [Glutamicibacter arilaitensis Re117]|uniref:Transposase of ISAar25, IS3 family, IS3 group, orfB n=1 Tax=Glutamicibacter arilaitensis (strain DSM 16368 / CIP 108037 / IAM 15318 / JCM 13566 / NCIMB 14258 / Re117) TaxID=861360 RepID=A0ABP1U8V9_GLUAR|nr:transposase of ISAar25, IS3 family, IS3 group, orfB [Glutamicibacter arilaitensis Re117]